MGADSLIVRWRPLEGLGTFATARRNGPGNEPVTRIRAAEDGGGAGCLLSGCLSARRASGAQQPQAVVALILRSICYVGTRTGGISVERCEPGRRIGSTTSSTRPCPLPLHRGIAIVWIDPCSSPCPGKFPRTIPSSTTGPLPVLHSGQAASGNNCFYSAF